MQSVENKRASGENAYMSGKCMLLSADAAELSIGIFFENVRSMYPTLKPHTRTFPFSYYFSPLSRRVHSRAKQTKTLLSSTLSNKYLLYS